MNTPDLPEDFEQSKGEVSIRPNKQGECSKEFLSVEGVLDLISLDTGDHLRWKRKDDRC